jgi:hypothetical protein
MRDKKQKTPQRIPSPRGNEKANVTYVTTV